jgi:hypothetical protein
MNIKQLKAISQKYDVRIDDHKGFKRSVPYYYDSLRHAFGYYFNTFISNNTGYSLYAEGLYKQNVSILKYQKLDEDNTLLTLIAFERFFELFIKDVLARVNKKLTYTAAQKAKGGTEAIINQILTGAFMPKKNDGKPLSIAFREAITRFYDLIDLTKTKPGLNSVIKRFSRILKKYAFLDSQIHKVTFQYLNWYRDRILHNGNKLPSLWLLDYTVTQRVIPIIASLLQVENKEKGFDFFYFKTVTGIDILEAFNNIKFEFKHLNSKNHQHDCYIKLHKIGHLKELGRANMNMNFFVRKNQATYEYNYKDPKGRGARFALAEKSHSDFKKISKCPCCGVESLVLYQIISDDIFNEGQKVKIEWVKCYTCEYHLRYDTYEPYLLDIFPDALFSE